MEAVCTAGLQVPLSMCLQLERTGVQYKMAPPLRGDFGATESDMPRAAGIGSCMVIFSSALFNHRYQTRELCDPQLQNVEFVKVRGLPLVL